MPYTSLIARSSSNPPAMTADDASALIPEEVSKEIIEGVIYDSIVMQLFPHIPVARKQLRMPVVSTLPTAYFVTGDTGLKQTTEQAWKNVYLNIEELAAIVPIPEAVLDDTDYQLWDMIKPKIKEALAVALDDAVLFGTNAPSTWPTSIAAAAKAAGVANKFGDNAPDIAQDINALMTLVENQGYDVNGVVLRTQLKGKLRGLRATTGELIFQPKAEDDGISGAQYTGRIWGEKTYVSKGGFSAFSTSADSTHYECILGDWTQGVLGVRQDITWKMLTEATLVDNNGMVVYNLAQQDMVALRVVMRVGWAVPNPINRLGSNDTNRYPFGVLKQG